MSKNVAITEKKKNNTSDLSHKPTKGHLPTKITPDIDFT